ncbi:alpha/beta hydrolase [Bradyrhizobium sp. USDA 4350]
MTIVETATSQASRSAWRLPLFGLLTEALQEIERSLLYQRTASRIAAPTVHPAAEEMVIATSDGEQLAAIHVPPAKGRPLVLYFHGNGQSLTSRTGRFRNLIAEGFGILAPSYRGYAGSTGQPNENGLYLDAHAAYDAAARLYGADRVVAWGYSLGTGVAVQLASERPLARLVLEAPFTSVPEVGSSMFPFLPIGALMSEQFCSRRRIASIGCPVLILHGRNDGIVPVSQGEALYGLAAEPKRLLLFDGGHMDLDRHGALDAAVEFIGNWRSRNAQEIEMAQAFDWTKSCSYDQEQKQAFHRTARARLKALAEVLELPEGSYDLRSNKAGIAVSGDVTLHHDKLYIQASQSAMVAENGAAHGLLVRTCKGRKDYTGGRNHMLHLKELDDPRALALKVLTISPSVRPDVVTDQDDPDYGGGLRP